MFHAPTSETKQQNDASRTALKPEQAREISPFVPTTPGPTWSRAADRGAPSASPLPGPQQQVMRLHSMYGNQAVLRMLSHSAPTIQTKLTVNQPGDPFEQGADRLADQVMRMTDPATVQRKCSSCAEEEKLQRKCTECEEEEKTTELHRKENATAPQFAPPLVHQTLNSPGQPLDPAARAFMEPRFGHDFGRIRVHTDQKAAESARSVGALAYTVGRHVIFGSGQYVPQSDRGLRLIAHELTHVVQQTGSRAQPALEKMRMSVASAPRGLFRSEESGEGREGGEAGPVGEAMCSIMPNSWIIGSVRTFFRIYPRALAHLDYYLSGHGGEYQEDVAALFRDNPDISARIGQLIEAIGDRSGTLSGTGRQGDDMPPPIRQTDYNSENWRLSLGNVDEVRYEILSDPDSTGTTPVRVTIRDPYEWHPAEARDTQCLHRVMEAQKTEGHARDFTSVGTATVSLRVGSRLSANR